MANKGNHPKMALFQVSELLQFARCYFLPFEQRVAYGHVT